MDLPRTSLTTEMPEYLVYCFLGMAESEDRKVFLWSQWEQCFFLFDQLLAPFASSSFIKSSQAYVVPLAPHKGDPPGIKRITLKKVPLGRLKWSQRPSQAGEYAIRLLNTRIFSS